jgi:hypothetical protein
LKAGIRFKSGVSDVSSCASDDTISDPSQNTSRAAYEQQTFSIGWDNFLRGRISTLWGKACCQEALCQQHWIDKKRWSANAIMAVLRYSQASWKFCCGLLHGRTLEKPINVS